MTIPELLHDQFQLASRWTLRTLEAIPAEQWHIIPTEAQLSVNWLSGHIIAAKYFHGVASVEGWTRLLNKPYTASFYGKNYNMTTTATVPREDQPGKEQILKDLADLDAYCLHLLKNMTPETLQEPVAVENPVANVKQEALVFCSHHQMYHNGQLSNLKKVLSRLLESA